MNEFQIELKALLDKYNATISWGCSPCSDTHGIYDEYMIVWGKDDNILLKLDGGYIDSYSIGGE